MLLSENAAKSLTLVHKAELDQSNFAVYLFTLVICFISVQLNRQNLLEILETYSLFALDKRING